jgi:hypothetical protein
MEILQSLVAKAGNLQLWLIDAILWRQPGGTVSLVRSLGEPVVSDRPSM